MEVKIGIPTEVPMQIQRRITPGGAAFAAAVLGLQVFLSRRKSRWLGLILPAACCGYTLANVLRASQRGLSSGLVKQLLLGGSRPVLALLVVYALCRWSLRRKGQEV